MLASVEEDFHLEWTKKRGAAQMNLNGISASLALMRFELNAALSVF
jgi:hypothetical protein